MTIENTAYASETVDVSERRHFVINSDLLDKIKQVVSATKEENTKESLDKIILFSVKYFLKNPLIRPNSTSVAPAIFVYYLETYLLFHPNENTEEAYNKACLSLFPMFTENYNDTILRKLMMEAGATLNEIITQRLSVIKDLTVADILPSLTHVAVAVESIRKFTSVKFRKNNKAYITWIGEFLQKCLDDPKLTFVEEDPSIKVILNQVTSGKKIITV